MTRIGKKLAAEREWREMTPRQRRPHALPKPHRAFTLYHATLIVAAILVIVVLDYFFPTMR